NEKEGVEIGTSYIITGLMFTKQAPVDEPTVTPEPDEPTVTPGPGEPGDSEAFTKGMTVQLDKSYSGDIAVVEGELATFYIADAEAKKGDIYTVTYTISGCDFNQIGFQTDADIDPSNPDTNKQYPWHNNYWSSDTPMPDGSVETHEIEVTATGVTKYTGGMVLCTLRTGTKVGSSGSTAIKIENLKVTVKRKVVDASARYEVVSINKPATEALDLASGEGWSNYQKAFAFPAGLEVDEVVAVWKSTGSFNGIFGSNVAGAWTELCKGSSSSGQSTWKVTGLSEKELGSEPFVSIQIWWAANGESTITLQKLIFAEKGADYSKELSTGSSTGGSTGGSIGGFIENLYPDLDSTPTPAPTTAPAEENPGEDDTDAKPVKAGDKISYNYAEYADIIDRIEVVLTSSGYFNGSLGLSIDGAWGQADGESSGGTVTWVYDKISGREANGYFEVQIWWVNDGVTVTLDRVTLYDKNGNVIGAEKGSETVDPDDGKEDPDDGKEDPDDSGEQGEKNETQVIRREIPGEGVTKVTNEVEPNKVLDANNEDGKMYQMPLDQFAESGTIRKFAVTITFDQPSVLGWTGGTGGVGFSTDKGWLTADFENAFIDGAKNTVRYEFEVPEGATVTMNTASDPSNLSTGSLFQVGWWWGSTPSITVDKIEVEQEKPNTKIVEITVSRTPVFLTETPGSHSVPLAELVADTSEIDSLILRVASTGKFKGAVYAKLSDGEIPLMADELTKIADIEMDEYGYADIMIDELAGLLEGELVLEITEIEEGATVVIDGIRLLNLDGEDLTDEPEWNPNPDDGDDPDDPDDPDDQGDIENPDDEDPDDQGDTENPDDEDPDDQGDTRDPDDGNDTDEPDDKKDTDLPKTGLVGSGYFYLTGLAMLLAGGILLLKKKEEA
nr:LPXTG cell wall anchor domain-containing protein [Lachnospiraceae bacterium]